MITPNPGAAGASIPGRVAIPVPQFLRSYARLRRSAAFMVVLTLGLVIAADVLFYHRPVGVTLPIFAAFVAIAVTLRSDRYLSLWPGRIAAVGLVGLCLALAEHVGPLRLTMTFTALVALALLNAHGYTRHVPVWISRGCEFVVRLLVQAPIDLVRGGRTSSRRAADTRRWAPIRSLAGWLVPAALSVVFIALFAAANPVISKWVQNTLTTLRDLLANLSLGRITLWLIVALGAWALLRARMRWTSPAAMRDVLDVAAAPLRSRTIVRCLALFNIVFAAQLGLDLATVLSAGSTLPEGMSYSEYARRGAYPLVATALLAAAFVLAAFPTQRRDAAGPWSRRLVYLWIAQNIVLMLSAMWRLNMYVQAFGLTRLRVAAAIWMLLVAVGLASIIWRLVAQRSNAWLMRINFLSLLVVLYVCCFINFDRMIAWHGVENSAELGGAGPRADLAYLRHLGIDSIPTLEWLASRIGTDDPVGRQAAEDAAELRGELKHQMRSWHGWTWRRAELMRGGGEGQGAP